MDIDIFDMEKPFVSVLIPAYNCASFIVQTLQSVLNQDYTNFEILICDDGSIDRTLEVIKALAKKDNRIKVYENVSNKGKVLTINHLLQEASGDYITILDSDDFFSPDKLERQVGFFEKNPEVGACGCNYASIVPQGRIVNTSALPLSDYEIRQYIQNHDLKDFAFCCPSLMIRREVYEQVGGYREFFITCCIGEDIDWILRISDKFQVANVDFVGYYYRFHPSSLTRKINFAIKNRHMHDIVAFLAKQRRENGVDFIETGDVGAYNELLEKLAEPYKKDKGLLYRKVVVEYSINKNRKYAWMYFKRLWKISGCSVSTLKVGVMMCVLLAFNYNFLLKVKGLLNISHLSSKV